ncbi:MAG: sigma-70 family RNA polymerase sigma factor, partial [bacterium]|nr:sigma-70 family RNA polymerase sigma factor [bacterium]
MGSVSDATLLKRWSRNRDAEAFKTLATKYAGVVYGACLRILHNRADAEEVSQECFQTLASTDRPPSGPFGPWLHRVATNRALDRARGERRRRERESRYVEARSDAVETTWDDVYEYVDAAIEGLPEKLRMAVVAHFIEDQTHEAIAAEEGVSRAAITQRVQRGVEQIRETLGKRGIVVAASALSVLMKVGMAEAAMPPTFTASLGKLALSGARTAGSPATFGAFAAKAALTIVGAGLVVAAVVWGVQSRPTPKPQALPAATTTPPAPAVEEPVTIPPPAEIAPEAPVAAVPEPQSRLCTVSGHVFFPEWRPDDGPVRVYAQRIEKDGNRVTSSRSVASQELEEPGGAYRIADLPPGLYLVAASVRSARGTREIDLQPSGTYSDIDLVIEPTGASLGGYVRDPDGNPLANVAVTVHSGMGTLFHVADTTTDTSGYYEVRHLSCQREGAGTRYLGAYYHVGFSLPRYHARNAYHEIALRQAEARRDVNCVMVPGLYTLHGQVVSDSGAGVAGVGIVGAGQSTRTEADGTFALAHLLDACDVRVNLSHQDNWYGMTPEKIRFAGGRDQTDAVFTASRGGTITGTLVAADGGTFSLTQLTLDGARQATVPELPPRGRGSRGYRAPEPAEVPVFASGTSFRFVGIPPGDHRVFTWPQPPYAAMVSEPVKLGPGQTMDLGPLVVDSGGTVVGTIRLEDNAIGIEAIRLESLRPEMKDVDYRLTTNPVLTGEIWTFTFDRVMTGPAEVRFNAQRPEPGRTVGWGNIRKVNVQPGKTVELRYSLAGPPPGDRRRDEKPEGEAVMEGIAVWDNGQPVEGASWQVRARRRKEGATGPDGRFQMEGLDPGKQYQVEVRTSQQKREGVFRPSDTVRLVFDRPAGIDALLRLRATNQPAANARVHVSGGGRRPMDMGVDSQGRFAVDIGATDEPTTLMAEAPGCIPLIVEGIRTRRG